MNCPANNIWEFNYHPPPGHRISQPKLSFCPPGPTLIGNHFLIDYQTQLLESKQQTQRPLFVLVSSHLLSRESSSPAEEDTSGGDLLHSWDWQKLDAISLCRYSLSLPLPSQSAPVAALHERGRREGDSYKRTTHATVYQWGSRHIQMNNEKEFK